MIDYLGMAYPRIATQLRKVSLAALPTPVSTHVIESTAARREIAIKHDEVTNADYGGNKIRKLEYLLQRALERNAQRVATFGAIGSNHALATALHARKVGLACTCFLAHQSATPYVAQTLAKHVELGTELVRFGGSVDRLTTFRRYLQHRATWVIPMGGSSWLGTVGFINAALELAAQIEAGEVASPDRIYIANGTMGSVAGLAIGFALLELPIEVHAVRVASNRYSYPGVLQRKINKTAAMLNRIDPRIPVDIGARCRAVWRDDFYAGGYAVADDATRRAVTIAKEQLGLSIETTYTGKAFAALLTDIGSFDGLALFWNTYSAPSSPLPLDAQVVQKIPGDFHRYLDAKLR